MEKYGFVIGIDQEDTTPLDEYVNSNDGYYNYRSLAGWSFGDHAVYLLNMTSQTW
jgi:hypothetical protein